MAFSICIQNLGMYNEGELLFKWLELPCTEEELSEAYDYIKVSHDDKEYFNEFGCPYEEIMIADWECKYSGLVGEWSNVDELNEIAEELEALSSTESDILEALMDNGYKFDEALSKINDCYYYPDCDSMTDVAYYCAEEYGLLDKIPEDLRQYFDFEAYGRDLGFSSTFLPCGTGYVEVI